MSDFNANISEPKPTSFCTLFKFANLVKEPTCYKNPNNCSCIDIILGNLSPVEYSTEKIQHIQNKANVHH